jgi:hypothetical protein
MLDGRRVLTGCLHRRLVANVAKPSWRPHGGMGPEGFSAKAKSRNAMSQVSIALVCYCSDSMASSLYKGMAPLLNCRAHNHLLPC